MSSVPDRLAECEQRNGGRLEDVIFRVEWCVVFFYVLCYVSRPQIHLFLQMLKYVLPYKCNCIMISNTFNFVLTFKNCPIRWRTLYISRFIYIYKTGGLPVYDTTLPWYLQIQSQFHYQTKAQDKNCHWLWQASNIRNLSKYPVSDDNWSLCFL